ncbi:HD domain-containing phosphohydrolase [Chitinivorax sp. B]|uniref:HD-GYP domain-containing protein n=1 Tax=Chitinivorax sp. B TaxID=2502235 RepID=UPI0014859734|nr:HD domain-containing phosphohydrolase [Chitinivorax sp. B]
MPANHQRIAEAHLTVGEPLPWDMHDEHGHLLLRKGYVLESEGQIDRLIDTGLYVDRDELAATEKAASEGEGAQSAVMPLLQAREQLDALAPQLKTPDLALDSMIDAIAQVVQRACDINPDIALAFIQQRQKGSYAVRHHVDSAILACIMAHSMKMPPQETHSLLCAALTMNLGMIEVQDKLNTITGELAPAVKTAIRAHPRKSMDILMHAQVKDPLWLDIVAHHHEADDGTGYPDGLRGEQIVLCAKLLNITDRYCARISIRGERPVALPNAVLRDILLESGHAIAPDIAAHFIKIIGIYPPGTMVRLANGEIGVVSKRAENAATPWVHAVIGPFGADLEFPIRRKTSDALYAIREAVDPRKYRMPFRMFPVWGKEAAGG